MWILFVLGTKLPSNIIHLKICKIVLKYTSFRKLKIKKYYIFLSLNF